LCELSKGMSVRHILSSQMSRSPEIGSRFSKVRLVKEIVRARKPLQARYERERKKLRDASLSMMSPRHQISLIY
jgi:hypothetical protein